VRADRDVTEISDFRAAVTVGFNARREDLTDLHARMDTGFAEMRANFDAAAAGQEQIVALLTTLIDLDPGE
jgi:hypothetical protein